MFQLDSLLIKEKFPKCHPYHGVDKGLRGVALYYTEHAGKSSPNPLDKDGQMCEEEKKSFFFFETGSHCVALSALELTV